MDFEIAILFSSIIRFFFILFCIRSK